MPFFKLHTTIIAMVIIILIEPLNKQIKKYPKIIITQVNIKINKIWWI